MSEHDAHDLAQTHDCKTVGCTGETSVTRGRYAYLCDECRHNAVAAARREPEPGPPGPSGPPSPDEVRGILPKPSPASYVERVESLLPLAAKVDGAKTDFVQARAALRDAMQDVFS